MTTTLSPDLTTAVPPALAERFNLRPGAQLDWEADEDRLVIHVKAAAPTREELARRLHELGAKHRAAAADAIGDLIRERADEDSERERML
jgi:antitoxin component of MazEF toxin-antitoxin module